MQPVDHPRDHVAHPRCKVVKRTEHVARHDGGEHVPVLLVVSSIRDIDHPFSVAIPKVGIMRWSVVDLQ